MKVEKIPTKTLRQRIYDRLRKKIASAEILPGQVMTLQGLAKEFGVSTMPVREALWQLESEKVIVIQSNKRIYVNELNQKDMEEALRLRLGLESMASERACERIKARDLSRIKRILDAMETASRDPKRYMVLNSQFHSTIYSYADSPLLLDIIDSLWARIAPYLNLLWEKAGDHLFTMEFHQGMYEALAHRNKDTLKEWLCQDLNQAAKVIIPFLKGSTAPPEGNKKGIAST